MTSPLFNSASDRSPISSTDLLRVIIVWASRVGRDTNLASCDCLLTSSGSFEFAFAKACSSFPSHEARSSSLSLTSLYS